MTNIRIVTDSTADLPQEIVEQYQITVIPLTVMIEGKPYLDRIDISNDEYYAKLRTLDTLPTTSQPSPAVFAAAYEKLAKEGAEDILAIHLSSDLSGTVQGAALAAKMVEDKVRVTVIDSRSATMGLGLVVYSAARAIAEGQSIAAVTAMVQSCVQNLDLLFLIDSLDNLQKGGRIGKAGFLVGSLLNIKPILRLKDGVIHAFEKVRGNKENKALERLIDDFCEQIDMTQPVYCAAGYCDNKELAEYMVSRIKQRHSQVDIVFMQIGCVVATHIGMGAVGVAFYQR